MASTLTSTSTSCPSDHLGWASVPLDVLFVILNKLSEYVDHVRVAGVCKGWRSIAKLYNNSTQRWHRVLPPMLLFPENSKGKSRNIHSRTKMRGVLYGVSEGKTYENIQLSLPSLISRTKTKRYFFGCGHGWLAQVEHRPQCHITLLNPFRKFEIVSLPPLDIDAGSFAPQKVKNIKVILSAVPNLNRDNYVVVAFSMYGKNRIAFFKGGQKDWTYTFGPYRFIDTIFCKGDLYAVECSGSTLRVSVFNVQSIFAKKAHSWQKPMARLVIETPRFSRFGYLVESTLGNLFYIQKRWRPENGRIPRNDKRPPAKVMFSVYELAFSIDEGQLMAEAVEVTSIGDEVLFVGDNQTSASVLASYFPGCQRNSIYYADAVLNFAAGPFRRYSVVPFDMGIFNLDEKETTLEYNYKKKRWKPYILWLTPPVEGL
ncbi:hypothetical protein C1H46_012008 [Malus baccata]|uniref:KIB1-4 beta-propeller domain-containing protein n=1 Tax=Malus baccata TaxID=106549 RepID=A0A540MUA6_MALBA|nr:hypothetical protein C1H46_012008 [Malus baccata]